MICDLCAPHLARLYDCGDFTIVRKHSPRPIDEVPIGQLAALIDCRGAQPPAHGSACAAGESLDGGTFRVNGREAEEGAEAEGGSVD